MYIEVSSVANFTTLQSITTRNYKLFRTSDLQEWYESHVVKSTVTSLKEF